LWKLANVIPVPKVTQPVECKDYRPVSILCVLAKAFEKIVYEQVNSYVESNKFLSMFQSGFRKGCSTISALLKVTDDIKKAMDNRSVTILALLDLSKAFDCVHHELLILKLRLLGFSNSACSWFESYLLKRHIRVFVNELNMSDWAHIITGVPQGSVLGPLLFLIYLFDLPSVIKNCSFHFYADDVQLYISCKPDEFGNAVTSVAGDVTALVDYFESHNLSLNVDKTQTLIIGTYKNIAALERTDVPPLIVCDKTVPYVKEAKNLGVVFDCHLKWEKHCKLIVKKTFSILAQLRRNMPYLPMHIRALLVKSLIFPHFDYALTLFTGLSKGMLCHLQRAQNAAVRFISYVPKHHHITPLYRSLNIFKIDERQHLKIAVLMWKIMKFHSPLYLYDIFQPLVVTNSNNTRFCSKVLKIPTHHTHLYNTSFTVEACRLYNRLRIYDMLDNSILTFKRVVIAHLLETSKN